MLHPITTTLLSLLLKYINYELKRIHVFMWTNVKQCDPTFFLKCLHATPKTCGFIKYLYQIPFVVLHKRSTGVNV